MGWHRVVLTATIGMLAAVACDIGQFTQTKETPEFVISVTNDPAHLQVGQAAKFYVTLRHDRQGVSQCKVRFRPKPRAETPNSDPGTEDWVEMVERSRNGVYAAHSRNFDHIGQWELEFSVNCSGIERIIQFAYDVERGASEPVG